VLGKDKFVELFSVYTQEETQKRTKKRITRLMKKRKSKTDEEDAEASMCGFLQLTCLAPR
jgi:hypothetical protein